MKQKLTKLEKYWVLYDVGNSAFTLLVSTIIPIYFKNMAQNMGVSASDSTAYLSYAISNLYDHCCNFRTDPRRSRRQQKP